MAKDYNDCILGIQLNSLLWICNGFFVLFCFLEQKWLPRGCGFISENIQVQDDTVSSFYENMNTFLILRGLASFISILFPLSVH